MNSTQNPAPGETRITGTMVNYYFVCQRKLWLFTHDVQLEHESDLVAQGKLIDETTYAEEKHGIEIDGTVVMDFSKVKDKVIHEIKKSNAVEQAHEWQLKYYLYVLNGMGVKGFSGEIDYPKLKKRIKVTLSPEDESKMQDILNQIEMIKHTELIPDTINKQFCKKCAYYEFCWS